MAPQQGSQIPESIVVPHRYAPDARNPVAEACATPFKEPPQGQRQWPRAASQPPVVGLEDCSLPDFEGEERDAPGGSVFMPVDRPHRLGPGEWDGREASRRDPREAPDEIAGPLPRNTPAEPSRRRTGLVQTGANSGTTGTQ